MRTVKPSWRQLLWLVFGAALLMLTALRVPPVHASGSVPVTQSTATPAPCASGCLHVKPDVIALLDPGRGGTAPVPPGSVIFLAQGTVVISRVTGFSNELDIELTASDDTHETIHLPFSVAPPASSLRFPQGATLDSVIGVRTTARILYKKGTRESFTTYTVSATPFMTSP